MPLINPVALRPSHVKYRRVSSRLALTCLLLVAVSVAGSGVAMGADATEAAQAQSALEDVEQLLEQINGFLETVADLLETVRSITGEGGEMEGED